MLFSSRRIATALGAGLVTAALGQTAFAECKEEEGTVLTVSGAIRAMVTDGGEPHLVVKRSNNEGCGVGTIWLSEIKLPERCKIGATVTATGKLGFGFFVEDEELESVQSLDCK